MSQVQPLSQNMNFEHNIAWRMCFTVWTRATHLNKNKVAITLPAYRSLVHVLKTWEHQVKVAGAETTVVHGHEVQTSRLVSSTRTCVQYMHVTFQTTRIIRRAPYVMPTVHKCRKHRTDVFTSRSKSDTTTRVSKLEFLHSAILLCPRLGYHLNFAKIMQYFPFKNGLHVLYTFMNKTTSNIFWISHDKLCPEHKNTESYQLCLPPSLCFRSKKMVLKSKHSSWKYPIQRARNVMPTSCVQFC